MFLNLDTTTNLMARLERTVCAGVPGREAHLAQLLRGLGVGQPEGHVAGTQGRTQSRSPRAHVTCQSTLEPRWKTT